MFRSKVDIDRHVKEIFRRCTSVEQRSFESLKIANLYLKIKDYESAKFYVQQYLTVRQSDAAGHELLGLCHEGLGNKIKAFEEFKICLSLNLNNKHILKKLANLAVDEQVPLDLVVDKYWIERIEQLLSTVPAESFKLKEKLMKMTQGNQNYSKQYEELLLAELEANPQSLNIYLKLFKLYKSSDRIVDAYKFAAANYSTNHKLKQEYVWFKELVDVCALYEIKVVATLNAKDKTKFYENYLVNIEKELKFALHEKGKKTVDLEKSLTLLDEVLYKFKSSVQNIDESARLSEKLLVQHYAAQLCFYALLILLKKTKMDIQNGLLAPDSLKDRLVSSAPLLLLALNPGLVLEFSPLSHGSSGPDNIAEMKAETNYRLSQCSQFLKILRKHGFLCDDSLQNSRDWMDKVYSILLQKGESSNRKSYLRSNLDQYKPASDLPLLHSDQPLRLDHVSGTELSHPCSLHHMVWLGVCQVLGSDSMLPPPLFKSTQTTPRIQFAARNIHLTHMNLCALDVDAFLYASLFCALSNLQQQAPPLLPADVTPQDLLVTPEQSRWWSLLFSHLQSSSEHNAPPSFRDGDVVAGVSLVRNVSQRSLHVAILVYLARCFAKRASDPGLSGSKELVKALEARSQHYWECALPALERLENNKNISGVSDTLFRYHGDPITSIEASAIIEEAKCMLGCFLLNADKVREASTMLKPLKSAFAKYNLAKIYVKLADDELRNDSSAQFDVSILIASSILQNPGNSPSFSYKYSLFLQKAKESLVSAQARLDADTTASSLVYYPDLSNRILDLLMEVELKLEQADGTEEKTLNMSNSSFSHPRRGSTHYSSPLSSVKHNPTMRHNTSQRLYFSPDPSNLNSTHLAHSGGASSQYKTIESTQVELLLERVKRLQDLCERLSDTVTGTRDSVSNMQAQLSDMTDKYVSVLESNRAVTDMHEKYLSVLESIKDLVRDKTDVIQSNTENLNSLTNKVNLLIGQDDIDDDFVLTDDYAEISPSVYPSPSSVPVRAAKAKTCLGSSGLGDMDGFYGSPVALTFSEGQTLPDFYQQQILASGFVMPPPPGAAQPASLKPLPPVSQMSMMVNNLTPLSTGAPEVKKTAAPHNVVITTSDRLPIGPPASTPQLSVSIPPQHLLGNKSKVTAIPPGVSTPGPAQAGGFAPSVPAAPFSNPPTAPAAAPVLFGLPSSTPALGAGALGKTQPPWMQDAGPGGVFPMAGIPGTAPPLLFGQSLFRMSAPPANIGPAFASPLKPFAPLSGPGPDAGSPAGVRPLFGQTSGFSAPASSSVFGVTAAFATGGPFIQSSPAGAGSQIRESPLATSSSPAGSLHATPLKGPSLTAVSGSSTPLNRSATLNTSGEGSHGAGSPHNFQIQMPPETDSMMKKVLERSPLIKQSLEQSTADSDDEADSMPEHDPMPDFKPIIALPDEVEVCTGEENETVLFERRAKLYRYADKEWKERGVGQLKLLKNNQSGKVRFLMRREIVHKICANHFLHPDMDLKPMPKSDKAYIWFAQDYADEVVSDEQLCARFKTPEDAEEFKSIFNASKVLNSASPDSMKPSGTQGGSVSGGFSKELTKVKPGSWECGQCYVMNGSGDKCVACGSNKVPASTPKSSPASNTSTAASTGESKYQLGGLTFSATPVLKKDSDTESKPTPKSKQGADIKTSTSAAASPSPFSSFSFSSLASTPASGQAANPFASFGTGFKFGPPAGSEQKASDSTSGGFPTLKTLLSSPHPVTAGTDFASLAKSSATASPFSSSSGGVFKGFAGAGTPLFGAQSTDKTGSEDANQSSPGAEDDSTPGEEFVPTAEFQPVIALPDLVTVVTGEEGSEVLWEGRSKLLRYDVENKEWKERGLGVMKLLRDQPGVVRLLMRREQVLKVCCNQRVTRDFELKSLSTSDKAWTWYNQDFSEGESKSDLFALKFKTSEQANEFRSKIETVVAELKTTPSPAKPTPSTGSAATGKPSLSSMFKPSAGSWECEGCFVRNPATETSCPACNTVKPGCEDSTAPTKPAAVAQPRFSFGVPKSESDDSAPALAVPQFKPAANVSSTAFTFGMPAANATASETAADPLATETEKPVSQTENNAFRFCSTKFSFSGVKPAVSPRTHRTSSGGYRTESESEADTTVEEEQDIHFQPVIPLPEIVELTTGEENETILYKHRAKLFRYLDGEWKERGVGDIKLLKHNENDKMRFIMRREPIEKICLNHHVDSTLLISPKDDKTWLWAAMDYSEGEWVQERFALRFKTSDIAQEFKQAVDQAVGNPVEPVKSRKDSSDDEVQIVHEKKLQLSAEEQALTLKYQLPPLFFEYKTKPPCPGCVGCEDDSEPAATSSSDKSTSFLVPPSVTLSNKQHLAVTGAASTPAGTPGSISFASSSSPIVPAADSSLSSLDSNKFSTPSGNIFTINSPSPGVKTGTLPPTTSGSKLFESSTGSLFGTKGSQAKPFEISGGSLFGTSGQSKPFQSAEGSLFGTGEQSKPFQSTEGSLFETGEQSKASPIFGMNVQGSLFGSGAGAGDSSTAFGKNLFGGSGEQKSIFGSGSANLFSGTPAAAQGSNFFGLKSSKLESVAPATPPSTTFTGGPFSGTGAPPSTFGAATRSGFGSAASLTAARKTTPAPSSTTASKDTASAAAGDLKTTKAAGEGIATPSFLAKADAAPSFADLAAKDTSFKPFSASGSTFTWEGAGTSVFGSSSTSTPNNTSTSRVNSSTGGEGDDDEEEEADGGAEYDPQFEPIIALPDIVEVKTGEEDEIKVFGERCKLYRYDKEAKQWKERGIGELKLLHHPEKMTYRLLMRREQIHKTVANFLVWPGLELKPSTSSDKAWVLTAMNLAEDYEEPELEELAIRFKTCELALEFKRIVEETVQRVTEIKANSSHDTSAASNTTQGTVETVNVEQDDEANPEDDDEVNVEDDEEDVDEEYEIVDEEEEDEEDDDDFDYEAMMKMSPLVELPATLLKRPNTQSKWESIGTGTARINSVAIDVDKFEYKVQVIDPSEEVTLDATLTGETTFQKKGKAIVWQGIDASMDEPSAQEIMLKFNSDDHVDNFLQYLQEGVTYTKEAYED